MPQFSKAEFERIVNFLAMGQTKGAWSLDLAATQVIPLFDRLQSTLADLKGQENLVMSDDDVEFTIQLIRHSQSQGSWTFGELKQLVLPVYVFLKSKPPAAPEASS